MTIEITRRPSGSGETCRSILAELPHWFGLPASNAGYADKAETGPCWIATAAGEALGLMILEIHNPDSWEVYLLAVRPDTHRQGIGRALIEKALAEASAAGARYLTVKTQGPSANYEPYGRTRRFYEAMGFVALEEFPTLWDENNPCLFMVTPTPAR